MLSNSTMFPSSELLSDIRKNRDNFQHYLTEINNLNITWIYEMILHSYNIILNSKEAPTTKLTALYLAKSILQKCEIPCIVLLQIYFAPVLFDIASQNKAYKKGKKGHRFFIDEGYSYRIPDIQKIGIQFVGLAGQLLYALSFIKKKKTLNNKQLQQQSESVTYWKMIENMKLPETPRSIEDLQYFDAQKLKILSTTYLKNLKSFEHKSEGYAQFFVGKIIESLLTQKNALLSHKYKSKGLLTDDLDLRKLFKSGDTYITSPLLQQIVDGIRISDNFIIKRNFLSLFSDFVKWADIQSIVSIMFDDFIDDIAVRIAQVDGQKGLQQGQKIYKQHRGQRQAKKKFYIQFLKCLELWQLLLSNNPFFQQQNQKSTKLQQFYEYLKNERGFIFPENIMIKKIKQQFDKRVLQNNQRNQKIIEHLKLDSQMLKNSTQQQQKSINQKISSMRKSAIKQNKKLFCVIKEQFEQCLKQLACLCEDQKSMDIKMEKLRNFRQNFDVDLENMTDQPSQDQFIEVLDDGDALISNINVIQGYYNDYINNIISFQQMKVLYQKKLDNVQKIAQSSSSVEQIWHTNHKDSQIMTHSVQQRQDDSQISKKQKVSIQQIKPQVKQSVKNSVEIIRSDKIQQQYVSVSEKSASFRSVSPNIGIQSIKSVQNQHELNSIKSVNNQHELKPIKQPIQLNSVQHQQLSQNIAHYQSNSSNSSKNQPIYTTPKLAQFKEDSFSKDQYYSIHNSQFPHDPSITDYTFVNLKNQAFKKPSSKMNDQLLQINDTHKLLDNGKKQIQIENVLENSLGQQSLYTLQGVNKNEHQNDSQRIVMQQQQYQITISQDDYKTVTNNQYESGESFLQKNMVMNKSKQYNQYHDSDLRSNIKNSINKNNDSQYSSRNNVRKVLETSRSKSSKSKLDSRISSKMDDSYMSNRKSSKKSNIKGSQIKINRSYSRQSSRKSRRHKKDKVVQKKQTINSEYLINNQQKQVSKKLNNQKIDRIHQLNSGDSLINSSRLSLKNQQIKLDHKNQKYTQQYGIKVFKENKNYNVTDSNYANKVKTDPQYLHNNQQRIQNISSNNNKHEFGIQQLIQVNQKNDPYYHKPQTLQNINKNHLTQKNSFKSQQIQKYSRQSLYGINSHISRKINKSKKNNIYSLDDDNQYLSLKHWKKDDEDLQSMRNRIQKLKKQSKQIRKQLTLRAQFNKSRSNSVSSNGYQIFSNANRSRSNSSSSQKSFSYSSSQNRFNHRNSFQEYPKKMKQITSTKYEKYFVKYGDDINFRRNLLRSKALAKKINRIEFGFVSKVQNINQIKLSLYITPQTILHDVSYQISAKNDFDISSYPKKFQNVVSDKQVKISMNIKIKSYPFQLPSIKLFYNSQGKKHQIDLILPVSPHKLCNFSAIAYTQTTSLQNTKTLTSRIFKINRKLLNKQKIKQYFPTAISIPINQNQYLYKTQCSLNYLDFQFNILMKGGSFMEIRVIAEEKLVGKMKALSQSIQFLLASYRKIFIHEKQK